MPRIDPMRHRRNPSSREERKREFNQWMKERASEEDFWLLDHFLRDYFDSYDPHGSVIGTLFDISDVLHDVSSVPDAWEFSPGAGRSPTLDELVDDANWWAMMFDLGKVKASDLKRLGNILHEADEKIRELDLNY